MGTGMPQKEYFGDISNTSGATAKCLRTGFTVTRPWLLLLVAGSPLRRSQPCESQRLEEQGLCGNGKGSTGTSFAIIKEFVEITRPACVLLENVPSLCERNEKTQESDPDYIVHQLQSMSYFATYRLFDAKDYG